MVFAIVFVSFFKKPQAAAGIFFMLTFRFSEAQVIKLINPFLLDSRDVGGLGLTTGEVGLAYGTVGIIGLTLGGIIGGFAAARGGLKKWIWPMTLSMLITILAFVYLSFAHTESLVIINTAYPQKASRKNINFGGWKKKKNTRRIFKNFLLNFRMSMTAGVIL